MSKRKCTQKPIADFFTKQAKFSVENQILRQPQPRDDSVTSHKSSNPRAVPAYGAVVLEDSNAPQQQELLTIRGDNLLTSTAQITSVSLAVSNNSAELPETPYHPSPSLTFPRDKESRACRADWFRLYPFLHYRAEEDSVICHVCATALKLNLVEFRETAFTTDGFRRWKKGLEKFKEHSLSSNHLAAVSSLRVRKHNAPVSALLDTQLRHQQKANREALLAIITSLKYLASCGLAIRGHDESSSNFMQLLTMRKDDIPALESWLLRRNNWTSWDIQNEILQLLAHSLQRDLLKDLQESPFFGICVDGTTDLSGQEQISLCVRFCDSNLNVKELFLGLYNPVDTTAKTIFCVISDAFLRLGLDFSKVRGHCFDGASNMSGAYSGVKVLLREKQPKSMYVHCVNHSLDLALQEAARECELVCEAMVAVREIGNAIRESSKRRQMYLNAEANQEIFIVEDEVEDGGHSNFSIETAENGKPRQLLSLCPTRWTVRQKAVERFLKHYRRIQDTLDAIIKDSGTKPETRSKLKGYSSKMNTFEFYFSLTITSLVMKPCEILAGSLQKRSVTAAGAKWAAGILVNTLQNKRESFEDLWDVVTNAANELGLLDPKEKRPSKVPLRYQHSEGDMTEILSAKTRLRKQYYEVTDRLINLVKERFDQEGLLELVKIESLILDAVFKRGIPTHEQVTESLGNQKNDFDVARLIAELTILSSMSIHLEGHVNGKNVEVKTVADVVSALIKLPPIACDMIPHVKKLVQLCISIPASSANVERSFSALNRIKTCYRTSMSQQRLTHLMLLHVHRESLDRIDVKDVCKKFVEKTSERKSTFGTEKLQND